MFDYFVPPQLSMEPLALVAIAASSQPKLTKPKIMCWDIGSDQPVSALHEFNILKPDDLKKYAQTDARKANYQVTLLEAPAHGKVGAYGEWSLTVGVPAQMGSSSMNYRPAQDYVGKDRALFLVDVYNKQYKVIVNFWVTPTVYDVPQGDTFCRTQNFGLTDALPSYTSSWMRSADLSAFLAAASGVSYTFSDLPGTAVGETTGEGANASITLDTNAAGHNWYIDPTPLDNSDDYLPTSDSTVWRAKVGSAADGKMDMLSVLLHEYGHALGLEHNANGADFMAASLQPGVRKLPSAAELTWMSQLVAELKGADGEALTLALSQREREQDNPFAPSPLSALGLLPLGFMRRNDGKGSANAAVATGAATATQTDYLTAINTTLANGSLHAGQTASIDQWQSVGNVAATPATASQGVTLGESTTAQAHLGQAFVLSAQDRFLTFTVSGLDLQTNSTEQNGEYGNIFTAAPQDAFEVALQNANTGANLLADGAGNLGNYPF